jgi:hypothetical protein
MGDGVAEARIRPQIQDRSTLILLHSLTDTATKYELHTRDGRFLTEVRSCAVPCLVRDLADVV